MAANRAGQKFRPLLLLHLLWTLPLAVAASALPFFYGAINVCGVSGCTGGGFGVSYGSEAAIWACAIAIALFFGLAVGAVPWARPHRVHLVAGAIVGFAVGAVLLIGWLGSKYEYYPAGIECYPATSRADCAS